MTHWRDAPSGMQYVAGNGIATVLPDFDFETFSTAGYVWNELERKWDSLPGLSVQNRGLGAVGTRNYVQHPSFRLLSLAWNLKDGKGVRWWRPDPSYEHLPASAYPRYDPNHGGACPAMIGQHCECPNTLHPVELIEHVALGRVLEAWGAQFEWQVWNFHCVPVLGWPPLDFDHEGLPRL